MGYSSEASMKCGRNSTTEKSDYSALQAIDPTAWQVIVPTFLEQSREEEKDSGTDQVPPGTSLFTEGLLRSILALTPAQQLELCQGFIKGNLTKNTFKTLAEAYDARLSPPHARGRECHRCGIVCHIAVGISAVVLLKRCGIVCHIGQPPA
jgi:hypothetical protein